MSTSAERAPLLPHPVETLSIPAPSPPDLEAPKPPLPPSSSPHTDPTLLETATTGRHLGLLSSLILILSRVIGSGIFAMPGTILQSVGSPLLSLLVWLAGAFIAWSALSIDLEYGCMLPRSGGMKVYLEYTYPWPRVGRLILRKRKPDLVRPFRAWTPLVWLRLCICGVLIFAPLFSPKKKEGESGGIFYAAYALVALSVLVFSVAYWYVLTRLLPWVGGYRLEEETSTLKDGTTITTLVRKKEW
ncbi:hypothetical protein KVT40_002815 [Elsinoe batatas]|uniref:Uncharacterized protein n=1 Tax=Elsinoe batatas TaxID=2601811 RepID=A0A8K0PE87_9PEZI|nr:hypothetical protein KVT40_002815 [Elsinoe batatas]